MTPDRILVARGPGETRAALLAGETLVEVVHIRDAETQAGAVYTGRVDDRVPGSTDVFVDIGVAPHGLLETKGRALKQGQWVAVEVLTPARADKGHKLALADVPLPADVKAPALLKAAPDPVEAWRALYKVNATRGEAFDEIEEQIDEALEQTMTLPGGGRVTFEQTAALVAVDIDAGASSIEAANAEAMSLIARQIRLRNLSGRIVVDLIHQKGKQRHVDALKALCADDPVETRVMGLTPSGLIDIVRRRTRPSLPESLFNADTTAYRALRLGCREMVARRVAKITLNVSPGVAALLNERLSGALAEARDTAKGEIVVTARADYPVKRVEVSG